MSKNAKNVKFSTFKILFVLIITLLIGLLTWFNMYLNNSNKQSPTINVSDSSHIPVAMALDDGYLYPTIVAITSIMENSNKDTLYDFYIMHPPEFQSENKEKLGSLSKKYERCHMEFIDMGDKYKTANDHGHITTPAYYRLSISELFPKLNKMLWIDGDTLTFHDLTEMYNTDMTGYYYKGFLCDNVSAVDSFDIYNDHCICDGVMVINLDELRKDDIVNTFTKFINENNDKLIQHDQTVINVVCYQKTGILPARFGIYTYDDAKQAAKQSKVYRCSYGYSAKELEDAYNDPTILHCIRKPWKSMQAPFASTWWEYAQKTNFFEEIRSKFPIF